MIEKKDIISIIMYREFEKWYDYLNNDADDDDND